MEPAETQEIERLVEESPDIGASPQPPKAYREARVGADEGDVVAVLSKLSNELARLDSLPARALKIGRHQSNPRAHPDSERWPPLPHRAHCPHHDRDDDARSAS